MHLRLRTSLPAPISLLTAGLAASVLLPAAAPGFRSVVYFGLVLAVAMLSGFGACRLCKAKPEVPIPVALWDFALASIWFAPAAVCARLGPAWGVAAGAVVAMVLARNFRAFQLAVSNREEGGSPGGGLRFGFVTGLALQLGAVALGAGRPVLALMLVGASCAAIAWQAGAPSRRRGVAAVLVAFTFVIVGSMLHHPKPGPGAIPLPVTTAFAGGDHLLKGVILKAEPKRYTLLLPTPLIRRNGPLRPARSKPISIPFTGEYWVFPSLYRNGVGRRVPLSQRPPMLSLVEHGDPLKNAFSSMRREMPLVMKAHQQLDEPLELSCCERFDVTVTNGDSPPGTVSMELMLLDSTPGRRRLQSLGEAGIPPTGRQAVLRFDVPRYATIERFDAIEVVFHLADPRRDRSARMAIERFDLIPRGF